MPCSKAQQQNISSMNTGLRQESGLRQRISPHHQSSEELSKNLIFTLRPPEFEWVMSCYQYFNYFMHT